MAGLSNIDAIYIALVFVVPGFIFLTFRNQFVPGQDRLGVDQILSFLTYSAINFALFGWAIYLAIAYQAAPYIRVTIWFLTLVAIPAGLGLFCGICAQREIVGRIYRFFGYAAVHPTPHAWERAFFNSPPAWVFITLKSGMQFAGFWGGESFASSDTKERDLFITEMFEFEDDQPWRRTGKSLFVAAGEISTVEFIPPIEET